MNWNTQRWKLAGFASAEDLVSDTFDGHGIETTDEVIALIAEDIDGDGESEASFMNAARSDLIDWVNCHRALEAVRQHRAVLQ